jgi:hypothetical protein
LQSPTIDDFLSQMKAGSVMHSYEGEMTESVVSEVLRDIEERLETEENDFKKSRKIYNILVEAMQNLYHHTDAFTPEVLDNGDEKRTTRIILARKEGEYHVLAANYIIKDNIPALKAKLDKINSLDKDGLREYYKEVLDNGQFSVHGGGGLGIIDIARKSGNSLDYEFSDVNDDYGLFGLKIKV